MGQYLSHNSFMGPKQAPSLQRRTTAPSGATTPRSSTSPTRDAGCERYLEWPDLGHGNALPPEGPRTRRLLGALLSGSRRPGIRHGDALGTVPKPRGSRQYAGGSGDSREKPPPLSPS